MSKLNEKMIFTNGTPENGASSAVTFADVTVSPVEGYYIMLKTSMKPIVGPDSITVTMQQADSEDGDWEDVDGFNVTMSGNDFKKDALKGIFPLPSAVTKQWLRLVYEIDGDITSGTALALLIPLHEDPNATEDEVE